MVCIVFVLFFGKFFFGLIGYVIDVVVVVVMILGVV